MRRLVGALVAGILLAPPAAAAMPHDPVPAPAVPIPRFDPADAPPRTRAVHWRPSRALGSPAAGRLVDGVQLPDEGRDFFTWDPVNLMSPNREWRRWGTSRLIRTLLRVISEYRAAHPWAPRVGIGDLSRPRGGPFGAQYGGLGHASHQNGLDADVYYPRVDHRLLAAYKPALVDRALAQDLVDRFVADGVQFVFVGTRTGLKVPRKVVEIIAHHSDHLHVRIYRPRG